MKKDYILDYSFYIYNGSFAYRDPCKCSYLEVSGKLVGKEDCVICEGKGKVYRHKNGFRNGGLYHVFNQILRAKYEGYNVHLVFDPPKENLTRSALLDDYKGNRPDCPEWIGTQMDWGEEQIRHIGSLNCYSATCDESDDVMATLALELANEGHKVVIGSDDKDMFPLLANSNIKLFRQKSLFDRADFIKKFGFEPNRFDEYLAIVGDAADNYNLISGLGPKTATHIIQKYKHVNELIDKPNKLDSYYRKKVDKVVDSLGKEVFRSELQKSLDLAQLNLKAPYTKLDGRNDRNFIFEQAAVMGLDNVTSNIRVFFED